MNLERYISPDNESSVFKGIPIALRHSDEVRNIMMTRDFTVKYRGKSRWVARFASLNDIPYGDFYVRPQSYCHKDMAETFAIYPYSNY